jgi:hypothetical protein
VFGDHVRHGHFLDSDGLDLRMIDRVSVGSEATYLLHDNHYRDYYCISLRLFRCLLMQ